MRNIIKIHLEFDKTYSYFIDHVKCSNKLSKTILEKIDLRQGSFFVLLPNNANLNQIYQFSRGHIIPPVPYGEKTYIVNGKEFHPQQVITMLGELSEFFLYFLTQNPRNYVLLDNIIASANESNLELEGANLFIQDEYVYYLLKNNNTIKQIRQSIRTAEEIWHFLAVVGTGANSLIKDTKQIDFDAVCETLNYIITGAYDGEGYIFWENSKRVPMLTPYEFLKARNGEEIFN